MKANVHWTFDLGEHTSISLRRRLTYPSAAQANLYQTRQKICDVGCSTSIEDLTQQDGDGKNDVVIANSDGITSIVYGKYTNIYFFPTSKQLVSRPRRPQDSKLKRKLRQN